MKFGTLTISTLTVGAAITGYSLFSGEEQESSLQSGKGNLGFSSQVIKQKQKTMWDILNEVNQLADKAQINIPTENQELLQIIDQNINLRMRIQSTKWYRNFLSGNLDIEEARKNIIDALFIENTLNDNPTLLYKLQYTEIWQSYIRGDISPHNIAYTELPALIFIEDFKKERSIIFEAIEGSSTFYKNEKGEETMFSERKNKITTIIKTEEFLRENPSVLNKLSQYGLSLTDMYRDEIGTGNFYLQMNAVIILLHQDNFSPDVWRKFLASEKGYLYATNQILPHEALVYINQII